MQSYSSLKITSTKPKFLVYQKNDLLKWPNNFSIEFFAD